MMSVERSLFSTDDKGIEGMTREGGEKLMIGFTCSYEGDDCITPQEERRVAKVISKNSYEHGIVLVRCPCEKVHLIADNLGWFGEEKNIEEIMRSKGEEVTRLIASDNLSIS